MKIIDFWAPWCMPCKAMTLTVDKLGIEKYNVDDDDKGYVIKYNVRSVPTLIKFDDEMNEISRLCGFRTEVQIRNWIYAEDK